MSEFQSILKDMSIADQTPEICLEAVNRDWRELQYVQNQTPEICLAAIRKHSRAFVYVKNPTYEMFLAATDPRPDLDTLLSMDRQTPEFQLEVVSKMGWVLQYIKTQTPELCMAAVKNHWYNLKYAKQQTPEMCMIAINQDAEAIRYVEDRTYDLLSAALRKNGYVLQYIREQTPELCMIAVCNHPIALEFVENQTPEICMTAVQHFGSSLKYVRIKTPELIRAAILQDPLATNYSHDTIPEDLELDTVKRNGLALESIHSPCFEVAFAAVMQNPKAVRYISNRDMLVRVVCAIVDQIPKDNGTSSTDTANKTNIFSSVDNTKKSDPDSKNIVADPNPSSVTKTPLESHDSPADKCDEEVVSVSELFD